MGVERRAGTPAPMGGGAGQVDGVPRGVHGDRVPGDAQLISIGRNQPEARAVIQIVGTFRGVAAAIAACLVLSGCASGQVGGETTTTSPAASETPSNPWDLPIEQRPALFDPCAEIPIGAVEAAVGAPLEWVEDLENSQPGGLKTCGWENGEVNFGLLSTWKSRDEYLADPAFRLKDAQAEIGGRTGLRLAEKVDAFDSTCLLLFFTSQGTVWVNLDLVTGLNQYKGRQQASACDALDEAALPIVQFIPEGEFL
ncbi:DUF3558 family protein [Rhodococcus sp. IEGM 1408]|uniref:DUF3558 family protein n=1 Tax=Rhodococcus sp. IEGM 1408 TaxID=3082220 RepID=UPI0029546FA4|nr:DUF3558 family protein [Rhodococcus sp. IEGM 1408]MDV8001524.1 DUF3558 family protein [Rhodococcus sp. IEGM 1408]